MLISLLAFSEIDHADGVLRAVGYLAILFETIIEGTALGALTWLIVH